MSVARSLPAPVSPEDRSIDALMRLARGTLRVLRREAAGSGLSMPQAMILSWLAREGPRPTTGWSDRIGTSASATSELVDGLEGMGLLERRGHPADRRQILIEITPEGRRLFGRIRSGQRDHLRRALEGLSASELERTIRTLEMLTERLGSDGPGDVPPSPVASPASPRRARPPSRSPDA